MLKFASIFLLCQICMQCSIVKAEDTVGIEIVDYHACKNVDYAPIDCLKYGEKYYEFYGNDNDKATWIEAVHTCRRSRGNLVTIETAAEMNAFSRYLDPKRVRFYRIWIAGNDLAESGEYMSIGNGRKLEYTNWATQQPTSRGGKCIGLKVENSAYAMFNLDCEEKLAFVCEKNTTIPNRIEYDNL